MRAFRLRLALVKFAASLEGMADGQPRRAFWLAIPGAVASFACALHLFRVPYEFDKYGRAMTRPEMLTLGAVAALMGFLLTGFVVVYLLQRRPTP